MNIYQDFRMFHVAPILIVFALFVIVFDAAAEEDPLVRTHFSAKFPNNFRLPNNHMSMPQTLNTQMEVFVIWGANAQPFDVVKEPTTTHLPVAHNAQREQENEPPLGLCVANKAERSELMRKSLTETFAHLHEKCRRKTRKLSDAFMYSCFPLLAKKKESERNDNGHIPRFAKMFEQKKQQKLTLELLLFDAPHSAAKAHAGIAHAGSKGLAGPGHWALDIAAQECEWVVRALKRMPHCDEGSAKNVEEIKCTILIEFFDEDGGRFKYVGNDKH